MSASCETEVVEPGAPTGRSGHGRTTGRSGPCSRSTSAAPPGSPRGRADMCPAVRRAEPVARWRRRLAGRRSGRTGVRGGRGSRPADSADREPVPAALQRGRIRATLMLTAIAAAAPGAGLTAASFDGKRAVGFALTCAAAAVGGELRLHVESPVAGGCLAAMARACEPEPRRARRSRSGSGRALAADGFWPVRVEGAVRFGTIVARLTVSMRGRLPPARPRDALGDRATKPPMPCLALHRWRQQPRFDVLREPRGGDRPPGTAGWP